MRYLTFFAVLVTSVVLSAAPDVGQKPDSYVTDRAGMLTPSERSALEGKLRAYEKQTTNELAVLIIPTLGDSSVEEFASVAFHQWGIGKKGKDNGVLFLWSTKERKLRLEVGYGLEEKLPDGRAGQIIREATPAFKASQWGQGVDEIMDGVIAQLAVKSPPPLTTAPEVYDGGLFWLFFTCFAGLGGVGFVIYRMTRPEPTPAIVLSTPYRPKPRASMIPGPLPVAIREKKRTYVPIPIPIVTRSEPEPEPYRPSPSYDPPSSSFDSGGGGSDFGGFGGGDSGGGGASGSY